MPSTPTAASAPIDFAQIPKPDTVAECHTVIDMLAAQLAFMQARIDALEERVNLNSRNSSKPPSSDGPGGPGGLNRAARRASTRKRGAQKGHKGTFRDLLPESDVDAIHECVPPAQCDCGGTVAASTNPYRHQVFDIPAAIVPEVQEYRLYSGCCLACGKRHKAPLPAGVPSGQIGPRTLALIGVLGSRYHLTQFKIRDLLAQIMGIDFSVGAISQAQGTVAQALHAPVAEAATTMATAPLVHMDETRSPREGLASNWMWVSVQPELAVFSALPSRAQYVARDLLSTAEQAQPSGVIVSDRYGVYAFIDAERRQVCWAHLIRDFTRIAQRPGKAGRTGHRLLGLAMVMFRWHHKNASVEQFARLQRRMRKALEQGAGGACSKTANTCTNLLRLWPALWTFVHNRAVPPTNNAAEQAIRNIVLKRKISGPTRSRRGELFIARTFSVIETCRRQKRDAMAFIYDAIVAFIDKTAPPSLLPKVAS